MARIGKADGRKWLGSAFCRCRIRDCPDSVKFAQSSQSVATLFGDNGPMTDTPSKMSAIKKFIGTPAFRIGLSVVMVVAVAYILYREIKPEEIEKAFEKANLWWVVAAFFVAALSWVGAAVPLKALADIKVPFTDATLVQVAASFVGVVAPMGLGPIGLHLRYLTKRGMKTASATAIVLFIEAAQFITSTLMLIVCLIIDHKFPHMNFPLKKILIIAAVVVVLAAATLLTKKVRDWVTEQVKSFLSQVKPQFAYVKNHPKDLVWSFLGVIVQTGTYALALVFCLKALGHPISIAMGITIYLIGNTLGSAVPTPGGIGSTLAALVGALHLVGVPTAVAASAVVLYRLVSFYLQVPIGAIAFEYMQKKQLL